jgi:hypothetical protein
MPTLQIFAEDSLKEIRIFLKDDIEKFTIHFATLHAYKSVIKTNDLTAVVDRDV